MSGGLWLYASHTSGRLRFRYTDTAASDNGSYENLESDIRLRRALTWLPWRAWFVSDRYRFWMRSTDHPPSKKSSANSPHAHEALMSYEISWYAGGYQKNISFFEASIPYLLCRSQQNAALQFTLVSQHKTKTRRCNSGNYAPMQRAALSPLRTSS